MRKAAAILCATAALTAIAVADREKAGSEPAKPPDQHVKREQAVREYLDKLPHDQRHKVLAALKSVWEDADVRKARHQLKESADNYKRTMRAAIEEVDPEMRDIVRPLVERMVKDGLPGGDFHPRRNVHDGLPRFNRLLGLSSEKLDALPREEKTLIDSVRERVLTDERVKEAGRTLENAEGRKRTEAWQALRRTVRQVAIEFEPQLGSLLEKLCGKD
ncbi:MAG: hypothetical protein ACR2OZ_00120 [Verrucomicrobiales bacterium]